jgi:CheY-like chemotaxis protein
MQLKNKLNKMGVDCHSGRNARLRLLKVTAPFHLMYLQIRDFRKCRRMASVMRINNSMTKDISEKSVLVVDDDERMLRALDKVLTSEGAVVTCSNRAGSAIEVLIEGKTPVDLVIVDLSMPFISGLTTVNAIHGHYPKLPIIVLTAFGSPDVRAACLEEGAVVFLEKPLDSHVLIDAIKGVFAQEGNGTNDPGQTEKSSGRIEGDQGKRN